MATQRQVEFLSKAVKLKGDLALPDGAGAVHAAGDAESPFLESLHKFTK